MITRLPIEVVRLDRTSLHLFTEATINGLSCSLIIDTGASRSVFSYQLLKERIRELPHNTDEMLSSGINSEIQQSHMGVAREMQLGRLSLHNVKMVLIDFEYINNLYAKFASKNIAGLLGSDILFRLKARIDYEKKILTLKK
jgi:hypothetical protein